MSKIPCKKCKSCGVYHDFSVISCNECGTDLTNIPALLVETENISVEEYGEINESVSVFVQKCSACGALNFTADKSSPIKVCFNCHKTRIAAVEPEEYSDKGDPRNNNSTATEESVAVSNRKNEPIVTMSDDDDDDDDGESSPWQGILGNIRTSVGAENANSAVPIFSTSPAVTAKNDEITDDDDADDDDDDDDLDISDWSNILGGKNKPSPNVKSQKCISSITLTAIRYGRLSFTLKSDSCGNYLLGRSANQREFLSKDLRVGNEHCYLYFRNGNWYVKDNHSSNGTAVNSKDIGLNGESKLSDGDELKLGHHHNSMAFSVTIR